MANQPNCDIELMVMPIRRESIGLAGDQNEEENEDDYVFDPGETSHNFANTAVLNEKLLIGRIRQVREEEFRDIISEVEDIFMRTSMGWEPMD